MKNHRLTSEQTRWVDETFSSMTVEEKVGHLLCPDDQRYTIEDWEKILREVPLGSLFIGKMASAAMVETLSAVQARVRIPLLVAADLENGAGCYVTDQTNFPSPMALAAASPEDDLSLAYEMGRATGREGRACGIHWTFSPVVDLNINFQNPVTNTRSLGDMPQPVSRLAAALIEGIQSDGLMAATAKHFPGDGMDDRDQHIGTSVNSLSQRKWAGSYGRVWQSVIDAGVMSMMAGHIAFPAYQGCADQPFQALPATLDPRLQVNLLREKLGFRGVLVSDASPMIGISSRVPSTEKAVANILAGSDVFLFADPYRDFAYLLEAVRTGRISSSRLDASVRRVLALKARLNLHIDPFGPRPGAHEQQHFENKAQEIADKSITLLRADAHTPVRLKPGARILTVTIRHENDHSTPLDQIDLELRQRGYQVEHLNNPGSVDINRHAAQADMVFVNIAIQPHDLMGTLRLTGQLISAFWQSFWLDYPNAVFSSFGTPYSLYEIPHLPNFYLAYSSSKASQTAAVRAWLGEIPADGRCPVQMPEKVNI